MAPGGQTVDLRGAGADVVERMGLLDQMKSRSLFQRGIAWVRSDGSRRAEMPVKPLGGYNGWFTAPDTVGLDSWYLMYQAPGLNASLRPSRDPAIAKAGSAFRSEPLDNDRRDLDEQRTLLVNRFAGVSKDRDLVLSDTHAPPRPTLLGLR